MAEIWKPQSLDVYKSWYTAIVDEASDSLSDWEMKFVEAIGNRLINKYTLTQAQAEKLEQIYAKYTK